METIGIIGAGNIGCNVAKAAIAAGYRVVISNSRGPETLGDVVAELGDDATAGTVEQAATAGGLVLVAVPLGRYDQLPADALTGRIVMDANNYYPTRDGDIPALRQRLASSSRLLQRHLAESRVVKVFNHIGAAEIPAEGVPTGTPGRRALAVWGDDQGAVDAVAAFVERLGFDALRAGGLDDSWRIEPNTPGYVQHLDASGLRAALDAAER